MFLEIDKQQSMLQNAYRRQPNPDFQEVNAIEFKLDKALESEEIYWKQRSREN